MCGIAGIFAYGPDAPPVDREELIRIRDQMRRRGPDGEGLWMSPDGRVGLGHRRLSIQDLSPTGAQPMATADGHYQIVFNGEIYNFRELRAELQGQGVTFRSTGDTEVLLYLYAKHGPAMVHRLRGMFAFAIWDAKNRSMFFARDHFGIKPLYVADDGKTIRFASQVKALVAGGAVNMAPDPAGHVGYLLWGHVPSPFTLYEGIRAVPEGTTFLVGANGRQENQEYFSVSGEIRKAIASHKPMSQADARAALREAVRDSVQHHLVSDVPVSVFLSAGVDSTTVAAVAAEFAGKQLRAVTLGFKEYEGTDLDEVPMAQRVASQLGMHHEVHRLSSTDFQQEYDRLLEVMDQPSIDGVNTYFVSKIASEAGVKVALSGLGGDEWFASYPSFDDIPRMVNFVKPWGSIPGFGRFSRMLTAPVLGRFMSPKYAGVFEYGGSWEGAYMLRRGMFMPWEIRKLIDQEFYEAGWCRLKLFEGEHSGLKGISSARLKVSILEATRYMRHQLLRDSDWAGMAHSVEIRTPLVDRDFFQRIIPLVLQDGPPTKGDLGRTLGTDALLEVIERRKTGFQVPIRQWLLESATPHPKERGLRGWARQVYDAGSRLWNILFLVSDAYGSNGGIAKFNRDVVQAACAEHRVLHLDVIPRNATSTQPDNFRQLSYWKPRTRGKFAYMLATLGLLKRRRNIDLVLSGHINFSPLAWLISKITRAKSVMVIHGIDAWTIRGNASVNFFSRRMSAIVSVSRVTLERYKAWAHPRSTEEYILPNAVDMTRYTPGPKNPELLKRYGLGGKKVILTLGRLVSEERYKGFDEVMEALPELRKTIPNVAYLVAGDGDDLDRLVSKAKTLGVGDAVVFSGFVSEAEKVDHYRIADAFVMPSRGEGFGIVLLEAMACGKPVVASAVDGGREALRDGMLGILVNPANQMEIGRAIQDAIHRPQTVPYGIDHFDSPHFNKRFRTILGEVLHH